MSTTYPEHKHGFPQKIVSMSELSILNVSVLMLDLFLTLMRAENSRNLVAILPNALARKRAGLLVLSGVLA